MIKLEYNNINPFIRFAQFLTISSNKQYTNIASYDYRFFFCYGGKGKILVNDISYDMQTGSAILWKPGIKYSLQLADGNSKMLLMGVNFDFTQNNCHKKTPIPPEKWRKFNPKNIIECVDFSNSSFFDSVIYLPNVPFLKNPTNNLVTEYISKKNFYEERMSGQLKGILSLIWRFETNNNVASKSEMLTEQVIEYIHYHFQENITNELLGKIFGYHPNYLNKIVVQNTGISIHQHIITCRIDAATELVHASDMKTSEIAHIVGFKDTAHFLKYFKKITGKNTKDFKN